MISLARRKLISMAAMADTAALAFVILALAVSSGMTSRFDQSTMASVHQLASPVLDDLFQAVTILGGTIFLAAFAVSAALYLWHQRQRRQAIFLLLGLASAGIVTTVLKLLFERARPETWIQITNETTFSFPSGHATGSLAIALIIVILLWKTRWRLTALLVSGLYVFLIGFSRLYLGVHYPSDILAGWCVATVCVLLAAILMMIKQPQKSKK